MRFITTIIAMTAHNLIDSNGLYFLIYPPNEYKKIPVHTISKPSAKLEINFVLHENHTSANNTTMNIT